MTSMLIDRYGDSKYEKELTAAKDHYCERRGRFFDDDEQWESYSNAFLEWYVTERPWGDTRLPPAKLAAQEESPNSEQRAALLALAASQRSLVEVKATTETGIEVVDIVGGAVFSVVEERSLAGVNPGDVVEIRLIGFWDQVLLGQTFLFHPDGTKAAIRNVVKSMRAARKPRATIIDQIALLRSKTRSYQHVPPQRIYQEMT